jgi:predicted nucleic acid-binding protein
MTEQQDARHMLDRAERAATAGDLASAAELLRGAARIQEEELGPLHPDLANTLNNLAIVAERTGSATEAEALYRRSAAIAAAALPSDHPMVVDSRQNLEDFCRARGLSIDAPAAVITPVPDTGITTKPVPPPSAAANPDTPATIGAQPVPAVRPPGRASHSLRWVAIGVVALVAAVFLALRPWSRREAPSKAPTPEPAAARPAEAVPPPVALPTRPAPIEQRRPPAAAGGITVATARICRTFSTSGGRWRCDPAVDPVSPGAIVLYTRVRSPRDTTVVHRWYRGDTLRQSVKLTIRANATDGYRTYSRQTVDSGADWHVEVRSAEGALLHERRFVVKNVGSP